MHCNGRASSHFGIFSQGRPWMICLHHPLRPRCGSAAYTEGCRDNASQHSFIDPRLQIGNLFSHCTNQHLDIYSPNSTHLQHLPSSIHPHITPSLTIPSPPSEQFIMSAPNAPLSDLTVNSTTPASSLEASPNVQPMHQGNAISALEMQRQLLQQKLAEQYVSPTLSKWQQQQLTPNQRK